MKIRRVVCLISFFLVMMISISAYGPWDFLGLMGKIKTMDAYLNDGAAAKVSGQIYHKEIKNDKPVYFIKNATIELADVKLFRSSFILYPDSDTIPNKSTITANGRVELFSVARNEGNYDEKDFYNSKGLVCKIKNVSIGSVDTPKLYKGDYLYKLQKSVANEYTKYLPGEEAGFLASVVVGDKSSLEGELKELFTFAGVAHVLAVSGLHVSFLCMGLYKLLRRLGTSFFSSAIVSGTFAIMYGLMTGLSISSFRAVGMFVIYLLAQVLGEDYDTATSLAVVSDILLLDNPLLIKNMSFIFSVGSIIGILLIAKPVSNELKVSNKLLKSLSFSFGITLATMPILEAMSYQISTYSILINLFVIPLMPFLLGLGLVGGVFKLALPLKLCHYLIFAIELLSDFFVKLPFPSVITGKPSLIKIVFYYIGLLIIIRIPVKTKRIRFVCLCICMLFMLTPFRSGFEIDIVDVGQGDGTLIHSGLLTDIFIDGGSTTEKQVGKYRLLPLLKYKGIRDIDYWFVTHGDEDHYNGCMELIEEGYRVKNLVVGKNAVMNENLLSIIRLAKSHGINVIYMDRGDEVKIGKLRLLCLYPGKVYSDDPNTQSLTMLLEYKKFSAFLGGDLTGEAEELIVSKGQIKRVDLLKVSHHGSKYSTCERLLKELRPKAATISCGKNNSYGHPAIETLNRLENYGVEIFRTDSQGQISIKEVSGKFIINVFLEK